MIRDTFHIVVFDRGAGCANETTSFLNDNNCGCNPFQPLRTQRNCHRLSSVVIGCHVAPNNERTSTFTFFAMARHLAKPRVTSCICTLCAVDRLRIEYDATLSPPRANATDSLPRLERMVLEMLRERLGDCSLEQPEAFPTSFPFLTRVNAGVHSVVHVPIFWYN